MTTTSCPTGKVSYDSKNSAWTELQTINARRKRQGRQKGTGWLHKSHYKVFHCPVCSAYHIGRSPDIRGGLHAIVFFAAMLAGSVSFADPSVSDDGTEFENSGRDCIALAVFTESRGESIDGQIAVAEVIKRRIESSQWPDMPCDVVEQIDQFHGFRDWPRPSHPREIDANSWEIALRVTDGVMLDGWTACPGVDHFFAGPAPAWAADMAPVCSIGGHQFVAEVR